jgi:hypothetical protein
LIHRFFDLDQVAFRDGQKAEISVAGCVVTMKGRFIDFTHFIFWGIQKAENTFQGFSATSNIALSSTKISFCEIQKAENEFAGLYDHLKHIFIDFTKFAFYGGQKTDHGPFAFLKHHFRDFVQVAFLDAQDAENNFAWPLASLKHAFIDIKVAFQDVQKADNEFSELKTSLPRFHPSRSLYA